MDHRVEGIEEAYQNSGQNFGLNAKVEGFGKGGLDWCGVLTRGNR